MANTTVNTVSYLGQLRLLSRRPNALLRLAGHFTGASVGEPFAYKESTSREFPIGITYALPSPAQPAILEGANAPAANTRSLTQTTNVIQIFQEAVNVSYLAQSDQTVSGVVPIPQGAVNGPLINPRSTAFQVKTTLEKMAQDMNYSFLNGAYVNPANPASTALKTRGVITAIASNITDKTGDTAGAVTAALYRGYFDSLLQSMVTFNGYSIDETFVVMANAVDYQNITNAYAAKGQIFLAPEIQMAGIQINKIRTTFGTLLLVLEPDMPANNIAVIKMSEVGIVALPVPNKGVLFEEPLYKQGSADQTQIYGQLGCDHGLEFMHGLLKVVTGIAIPS